MSFDLGSATVGYMVGLSSCDDSSSNISGKVFTLIGQVFSRLLPFTILILIIYENTPIKPVFEEIYKSILESSGLSVDNCLPFALTCFRLCLFGAFLGIFYMVGYVVYKIIKNN